MKFTFLLFVVFSSISFASEPAPETDTKPTPKAEKSSTNYAGDFGLGVGIGVNSLSDDYINNAVIANGKVNVLDSESVRTQLWLEGHYLFGGDYTSWNCKEPCRIINEKTGLEETLPANSTYYRKRRFYHGPFFAIQVSDSDSLLNGAALGYMVSLKKSALDSKDDRYFNIGIGVSSTKVRGLSGGYEDGQDFPNGDQLTYKTTTETGLLLLFSVNVF